MVDCVYHSLCGLLKEEGFPPSSQVRIIYALMREVTGHKASDMTFAGIVPAIAMLVAQWYGIEFTIEQNNFFDLKVQANEQEKNWVFDMRHNPITPGRGVYCGYFKVHAFYWPHDSLPEGDEWVLSIKFRRLLK